MPNDPEGSPSPSNIERCYKVAEIAAQWSLHPNTIRRIFRDEPGVLMIGEERARLVKRKYTQRHVVMRIPESVFLRVQERLMHKRTPDSVGLLRLRSNSRDLHAS